MLTEQVLLDDDVPASNDWYRESGQAGRRYPPVVERGLHRHCGTLFCQRRGQIRESV